MYKILVLISINLVGHVLVLVCTNHLMNHLPTLNIGKNLHLCHRYLLAKLKHLSHLYLPIYICVKHYALGCAKLIV